MTASLIEHNALLCSAIGGGGLATTWSGFSRSEKFRRVLICAVIDYKSDRFIYYGKLYTCYGNNNSSK